MPIPIRSIGVKASGESSDTKTTEATMTLPAPSSVSVGDRLIAVVVVTYSARPNTQVVASTTPSGWTANTTSQDANIGVSARTGTRLVTYERTATGSDFPVTFDTFTPSSATDGAAAIQGFAIACRGDIARVDDGGESGAANNINPTNSYTIDSHPTAEGGSLMFVAVAASEPALYPGGENGMTLLHEVSFNGDVTRWAGIAVAEGSTTPTTADAAQWDVTSGGAQWATLFYTYGPVGGGIFVDGAVHLN